MEKENSLKEQVFQMIAQNGINTILFRNMLTKKQGITLTDSLCLTYLGLHGHATPTKLSEFTGLSSGATTAMLDRLQKKKFIKRITHKKDRRSVIVHINPQYTKKTLHMVNGIQNAYKELINKFSNDELSIILSFFSLLVETVSNETSKLDKR